MIKEQRQKEDARQLQLGRLLLVLFVGLQMRAVILAVPPVLPAIRADLLPAVSPGTGEEALPLDNSVQRAAHVRAVQSIGAKSL